MLKVPSQIEKFESRSDNTWKLIVGTSELTQEDVAELAMLKGKEGMFVFAVQEGIKEKDIPEILPEFKGEKTPAQRLRGVLYRIWEQQSVLSDKIRPDFETFYRSRMERLIEQLKEKLV